MIAAVRDQRGMSHQLSREINNEPFQCSHGRNPLQRRHSDARLGQGDLLFSLVTADHISPRPGARRRPRGRHRE